MKIFDFYNYQTKPFLMLASIFYRSGGNIAYFAYTDLLIRKYYL